MEYYKQRRVVYKAWNYRDKLFVRPGAIPCVRGELVLENHVLLQFTGMHDRQGEEIYEMDLLLRDQARFVVVWDDHSGWILQALSGGGTTGALTGQVAGSCSRLCSYFESAESQNLRIR